MADATPLALLIAAVAGFLAASVNAFAGGGSLISFPLLVGLGFTELRASATNTVALWPGSLASTLGLWEKLKGMRRELLILLAPSIIGACSGAWLLRLVGEDGFKAIIPALILFAAILLFYQALAKKGEREEVAVARMPLAIGIQLLISIYGGFLGAGIGLMMLALFGQTLPGDTHDHNALKNALALVMNVSASGVLILSGLVHPLFAVCGAAGAIVGGFTCARISLKIDPQKLRLAVAIYGIVMAAIFAWRSWL